MYLYAAPDGIDVIRRVATLIGLAGIQVLASVPNVSRTAHAQSPPTQDSIPRDSEAGRQVGVGCEMCLAAAMAAWAAVNLVAPAVFALSPKLTNPAPGGLPDHHVSAYLAGGDGARLRNSKDQWTYSESMEVLTHHLYGEVHIENFFTPDHVEFRTVRAGYLLHPKPAVFGGVTLGYRTTHGVQGENAWEVGLPGRFGNERGAFRFEPTYVISGEGISWNYRLQMELYIPSPNLVTGVVFEAKPLRQGDPYFGTFALLLGVRF